MKIISSKTLGKEFVTTEELSYGFPNDNWELLLIRCFSTRV